MCPTEEALAAQTPDEDEDIEDLKVGGCVTLGLFWGLWQVCCCYCCYDPLVALPAHNRVAVEQVMPVLERPACCAGKLCHACVHAHCPKSFSCS